MISFRQFCCFSDSLEKSRNIRWRIQDGEGCPILTTCLSLESGDSSGATGTSCTSGECETFQRNNMKHLLLPLHIIIDRILSVVLRKGSSQLVGLVRVVQLVELSGEIAYHYSYSPFER